MPTLPFTTLDVFTNSRYTGNPLAIVRIPTNHDIPTPEMQAIASEFNLSETLFIYERNSDSSKNETAEWKVRIFLTNREIPFAGHPTIGASVYALSTLSPGTKQGRLICGAGPIEISYDSSANAATAQIPHAFHQHVSHTFPLDKVYGLQPALRNVSGLGIKQQHVAVVSPVKGLSFVTVQLPSLEALAVLGTSAIHPDPVLDEGWAGGFAASYWYVPMGEDGGKVTLRTRMIEATLEDPATGSAACALCMYLALQRGAGRVEFEITQGVEMGRESHIGVIVETKKGGNGMEVENVYLKGGAVKVMEGTIEY